MGISENLKEARSLSGMTQAELASVIDVTPKDISRWEHGVRVPNATSLAKICRALNVSADSILGLK